MPRAHSPIPRPARRAAATLALLSFLLASLGLLPSPAWIWRQIPAAADHPCAGHGCGCDSLERCWARCGCYTRVERLAWSIRHNAPVPPSARPTETEWRLASASVQAPEQPGPPACPLCPADEPADETPNARLTLSALGCQGVSPWIAVPPIPTDPRGPAPLILPLADAGPAPAEAWLRPVSRTLEAPTPPPRSI